MKDIVYHIVARVAGKGFGREYKEFVRCSLREEYCIPALLDELLAHAERNVPYWAETLKNHRVFQDLPLFTKAIIRRQGSRCISADHTARGSYENSSGGSTGEPVRFLQDARYKAWRHATNLYYYRNILGIEEPAARKVLLWGSERDIFEGKTPWKMRVINWLRNTVFLNSFRMTERDMDGYIATMNRFKPELVRGYAGSLYEIALRALATNAPLYSPRALVSSAEVLSLHMRETIERAFKTKVHDFYGSREVSNLAGECKEGNLHTFPSFNTVEVLTESGSNAKEGERGRVVVTNLHNYSMPFIRYEIGDEAVAGPARCPCGHPFPTLKNVIGRVTDHFVKKDGTLVHGEYFTHLFYLRDWVKAFRVVQEDFSAIRILIVFRAPVPQAEQEEIEQKMRLVMGEKCHLVWQECKEIPPTASGKYIYTMSTVAR